MKCQNLFSEKNKKNAVNQMSDEYDLRVVKDNRLEFEVQLHFFILILISSF